MTIKEMIQALYDKEIGNVDMSIRIDELSTTGQWDNKQFTLNCIIDSTSFNKLSFDSNWSYNDAYGIIYGSTDGGTNYTQINKFTSNLIGIELDISTYNKIKFYGYAEPAGGWGGGNFANIVFSV